jgi:hypothetical protein
MFACQAKLPRLDSCTAPQRAISKGDLTVTTEKREQPREAALAKLAEYAQGRISDVKRGAETAELAALLLQKYGYGLCDALAVCYPESGPCPTYHDVDRMVESIDPDWRESARKRWAAKPAGISF